uniref:SERPIN domain-containing protein n=1 Tax=Caenorhabditis tropicalis TaxID=1561998 RepID=A0A1I7TEX2_9PELO
MVHPKAGSYGAVAQNARKRQKEATSNGKISQVKKALPPTPAGKKINGRTRSQERAQTAEENRKNNERILLQKKLEQNGGNIDNMELGDFEKMLDLMETDEKSGEQVSEKEEEPDKKSEKTKLKLAQKLIQKFKVDREDYMLQYADAQERPIFFEEYQSKCYPCLYTAELQELKVDVAGVSEKLLEYANALVSGYVPPTPHQLPGVLLHCESFRTTSQNVNICISPLQILRGWSLLINIARNKTLDELSNFICKHSSDILKTKEDFNAQLLALHIEAEDFSMDVFVYLLNYLIIFDIMMIFGEE